MFLNIRFLPPCVRLQNVVFCKHKFINDEFLNTNISYNLNQDRSTSENDNYHILIMHFNSQLLNITSAFIYVT